MISSSQLGVKSPLIKTKLKLFILVGLFKRTYMGIGKQYHNKYPVDLCLCEPGGWFIIVWSGIMWFFFFFFCRLFLDTFQRQIKKIIYPCLLVNFIVKLRCHIGWLLLELSLLTYWPGLSSLLNTWLDVCHSNLKTKPEK